ncbi:MAG TPA: GNAT family N-acetyltransferase [Xanthobacteraceae bacterium]|nr:GNAT family N-acetyltransferase [Xanthobacteraceae bacterium]
MSASNVSLRPSGPRDDDAPAAAGVNRHVARIADDQQQELALSVSPPLAVAPPAEADSGSGVHLEIHGGLREVEREWKVFEQHADRTVFQSFDWLAAWQRFIGASQGTVPAIVLGRDADGQLLFILQLAIERHRFARTLTWLGWRLCDYNAPLLAENFSDRMSAERFLLAWRDVVALLRADPRFRFDLIDLQKMPAAVGGQRNPFLDLAAFDFQVLAHPSGAYVANLGNEWDAFYAAKRSSATRKKERKQLKHLAEHGDVRFVEVRDRDEVAATLATLMRQKSRAFARMGVEDFFARPGYREFFTAIATDPALRDVIHVSRLDVGATTVATNVGLKFRGCYYLILSSYDDGELSRFGPGRAHLHELLRNAIDGGFARFDFTVGDEPYKRDWSDTELALYDHLAAVTLRGWLVMALTTAFRRTKRFIKQSPTLWPVFSKARAFAGLLGKR